MTYPEYIVLFDALVYAANEESEKGKKVNSVADRKEYNKQTTPTDTQLADIKAMLARYQPKSGA